MDTQEKHEAAGGGTTFSPRIGSRTQEKGMESEKNVSRSEGGNGTHNFRERFGALKDTVVDRTQEYAKATDYYVNKKPWTAVGIGVGVGILLGMMLSPKGKHRTYA